MTRPRTHLTVLSMVAAFSAGLAGAQEHSGTDKVTLKQALGLQQNGSPAPQMDAACKQKFGKYLGATVSTDYKIDPKTLIMSATSTFQSVPTKLYPMGISSGYYFMSDGIPPALKALGVMRIIFNVNKAYQNATSKLMFPLGVETYNCLLTSSPIVPEDGEALTKASSGS